MHNTRIDSPMVNETLPPAQESLGSDGSSAELKSLVDQLCLIFDRPFAEQCRMLNRAAQGCRPSPAEQEVLIRDFGFPATCKEFGGWQILARAYLWKNPQYVMD